MTRQHREILLGSFQRALAACLREEVKFGEGTINRLLGSGDRMPLKSIAPARFGNGAAIDIYPGKASIFFLDQFTSVSDQALIFQSVRDDPSVKEILSDPSVYCLTGHNYLDFCSSSKGDGINLLLKHFPDLWRDQRVLVLGDSVNDETLFCHQYEGSKTPVMRVFVGDNDILVSRINSALQNLSQEPLAVSKGSYTKGTEELLRKLSTQ
jgi:hypothetical protein